MPITDTNLSLKEVDIRFTLHLAGWSAGGDSGTYVVPPALIPI